MTDQVQSMKDAASPNLGEIEYLIKAMAPLLGDMAKDGVSCTPHAKALARISYEPFARPDEIDVIVPMEEARRIIKELS